MNSETKMYRATMFHDGKRVASYVSTNKRQARLGLFHESQLAYELFKSGHKITYTESA
jgi:hypothetical protein